MLGFGLNPQSIMAGRTPTPKVMDSGEDSHNSNKQFPRVAGSRKSDNRYSAINELHEL